MLLGVWTSDALSAHTAGVNCWAFWLFTYLGPWAVARGLLKPRDDHKALRRCENPAGSCGIARGWWNSKDTLHGTSQLDSNVWIQHTFSATVHINLIAKHYANSAGPGPREREDGLPQHFRSTTSSLSFDEIRYCLGHISGLSAGELWPDPEPPLQGNAPGARLCLLSSPISAEL